MTQQEAEDNTYAPIPMVLSPMRVEPRHYALGVPGENAPYRGPHDTMRYTVRATPQIYGDGHTPPGSSRRTIVYSVRIAHGVDEGGPWWSYDAELDLRDHAGFAAIYTLGGKTLRPGEVAGSVIVRLSRAAISLGAPKWLMVKAARDELVHAGAVVPECSLPHCGGDHRLASRRLDAIRERYVAEI